jgi:ribosomal-protein-alanine N-acetyltransferase
VTDDVDHIMAIMEAAFEPTYGEAWNRRQVEDSLLFGNCHYLLIRADGQEGAKGQEEANDQEETGGPIAGFSLSRSGFGEEELLLFAIAPAYRLKGHGRTLLEYFARAAKSRGANRLLLEMRKGNPAEYLYRSFGFVPIGERPNYYCTSDGQRIDAITFAYEFD